MVVRNAALLIAIMLTVVSAACTGQVQNTGSTAPQKETQIAKVTDPVCGMQIDPAEAAGKSEYKGKTYYFCNPYCKKTFDADPEAVLNKDSKKK